ALAVWGFGWESEGEIPARPWQAAPEGTPPAPPGADVYRELGPTLLGSIWTERTWPLSKFTEQENLYRPSEMSFYTGQSVGRVAANLQIASFFFRSTMNTPGG